MDEVFDEEKLKIKFEGQTHQVDVNTLTSSLLILSEALKEISSELNTGKNVEIKIEALSPGSFEVHAIVAAINSNDLLSAIATASGVAGGGVLVMGTIVKTYTGLVKLRTWFKDKNKTDVESVSDEGGSTTIKTSTGDIYVCPNVVYNIYNTSQPINDIISDQFRVLDEDPAVEGLTLTSPQDSFSIDKDNFSALAQKVEVNSENRKKEVKENQIIAIVKPVLEKSTTRRWEFIWGGNRISANITDVGFLEKVEQGEFRFGTGDTLKVDLLIHQTLNPVYNAWMNESYQITLIHEHIPRQRSVNRKLEL